MKTKRYNVALQRGYLTITESYQLGLGAAVTSYYHNDRHEDSLSGHGETLSQALDDQAKCLARLSKEIRQLATDFRYLEKKAGKR